MKTLSFTTTIKASADKVWFCLWNDYNYRKWTATFHEGSYAVSDWQQGSSIQFLSSNGSGIQSTITEMIPNKKMVFTHQGELKNFKLDENSKESAMWKGSTESYTLSEDQGTTTLTVELVSTDDFVDYFSGVFPKALEAIKENAEHFAITIETVVNAPVEKVWKIWSEPEHIKKWNSASPDWHTPKAENDLRVGGTFSSRMEAKDGSFGFDFGGTYSVVDTHKQISYSMGDGRKVTVIFTQMGDTTKITETFDPENQNSYDMQYGGWNAILNNFKLYTEAN